jgi:DNA polymerase delta subunit 1
MINIDSKRQRATNDGEFKTTSFRPVPTAVDPAVDSLLINWMDVDTVLVNEPLRDNPRKGTIVPGATSGKVPVIRMYGVDEQGCSVTVNVHGFTPYMYCQKPHGFTEDDLDMFRANLEAEVIKRKRGKETKEIETHILAVDIVNRQSVYGYADYEVMPEVLLIYVAVPELIMTVKYVLQNGFAFASYPEMSYQTYESNIPFIIRFMVDTKIFGCNWIELKAGTYATRSPRFAGTHAQREYDVTYNNLVSHSTSTHSRVGKVSMLSFDIECMGRKGHFPTPELDPIIQIGNVVYTQGENILTAKHIIFVLDGCTPIAGAEVRSFKSEAHMLVEWSKFVLAVDPDILTGYNIQNFDVPYILNRATQLRVRHQVGLLGRVKHESAEMVSSTFSSAAFGTRESVDTTIRGRVMIDMIQYMRRNHKLSSYSLNSVSTTFLNKQKDDVQVAEIAVLHRGTLDDRQRLARYCLTDCVRPVELAIKLQVVVNHVEMARVTGVPLSFLFTRGQQVKVLSMLYRKAREFDMIIPVFARAENGAAIVKIENGWEDRGHDELYFGDELEVTEDTSGKGKPASKLSKDVAYEGATVLEPKCALYQTPIATLDFASLYPSIMRAHNLCYTTLLSPSQVARMKPEDYETSPCGHSFVRAHIRVGLLPAILAELLDARSQAKKDMKKAKDEFERDVMNGRQLALKVSANSVYGFTGAVVGALPCVPISASVTAYGREMIEATKNFVETHYCIANGFKANADVIYGDTDSVMVKFGVNTVQEAIELGAEAAKLATKLFTTPISLEFEKIYYPYLLMAKKRYAGMYWTKPDKPDKMDMKGLEAVRRDNCQLVRTVIHTCLNKILRDMDVKGAVAYVKHMVSDLLQDRIDLSMLVITKALAASYKNKQPHAELAMRMSRRDAGSAPVTGDRVPYVFIKGHKKDPGYMKSESPLYVLENSIPIDVTYYLENQLAKPLARLFECILPDPRILIHGDHTLKICKVTPSASVGIMRFTAKRNKCLGCKALLAEDRADQSVCDHCLPKRQSVYLHKRQEMSAHEAKFHKLWTNCQQCQGSFHQPVICGSVECEFFYRRRKVQKEMQDIEDALQRFTM